MKRYCFTAYFLSLAIFIGTVMSAHNAHASTNIRALNKNNVTKFIEKATDITSGEARGDMSSSEIKRYLNKHIEKKARFKSLLKYHIPGMPAQETSLSLNKVNFIKSVSEGADKIDDYQTLIEIKDIKIASGGKKAIVKTESTEYANMPVPTSTGVEDIPIEGLSTCTQILSLNKGTIQMYSANCVTNIHFTEY